MHILPVPFCFSALIFGLMHLAEGVRRPFRVIDLFASTSFVDCVFGWAFVFCFLFIKETGKRKIRLIRTNTNTPFVLLSHTMVGSLNVFFEFNVLAVDAGSVGEFGTYLLFTTI